MLDILTCSYRNATNSSANSATAAGDDPASHENEGFLKSVWHKMTNHPAHQTKAEGETATKPIDESSTQKTDQDGEKKKPESETKKSDST